MLSDAELTIDSRLIVIAEVESVSSTWDEVNGVAWTYVELLSSRTLKGSITEERLVLKQIGGLTSGTGMHVLGQPTFATGQRVLLYLNPGRDGSLHVAHGFMGMFLISENAITGLTTVTRWDASSEVEIVPRLAGGTVTDRASLNDYISSIEETLSREAAVIAEINSSRAAEQILAIPAEFSQIKSSGGLIQPNFTFLASGVRWMEADLGQAISFSVNPTDSPISGGGNAEISRAMAAWSDQSGANIRLQSAGQTSRCGIARDGANTISFGDCLGQLDPPINCSGVVAQTSVAFSSESRVVGGQSFNRIIESDVIFNKGMNCFLGTSANLAEVTCHELGHAIGLGHSTDSTAIMFSIAHGRGFDARLAEDDRLGVLAIYPAVGGPPPPPPTPGNQALFISQSIPASMIARQSYTVFVTVRNSGSTTWLPGNGYRLGSQNPPNNFIWGLNRVPVTGSVSPGAQTTFSFIVTAPASAGSYNFQWRMLQEGVGFFGPATTNVVVNVSSANPLAPAVTRVKVKKTKKLFVWGTNFTQNSVIEFNGSVLVPTSIAIDGSPGKLTFKGRLTVGAKGTNRLFVINGSTRSALFTF
jgi:hypothetical protein